jgi:outer membrane protein
VNRTVRSFLTLVASLLPSAVLAQDGARLITLEQAIQTALQDHPTLAREAALEQAADARLDLARTGYLPQLDIGLQANRATANVVRGATFPTPGLPSISGPVGEPVMDSGAYGSLASLSTSWDVLGLLARVASVDAALRDRDRTHAGGDVVRLQITFNVADAFLGTLARAEAVKAASASEERASVFENAVRALTEHDLRPGADLSRSQAEKALASTQLIRAQQAQTIAEIELAQAIGESGRVTPLAGNLLEPPPEGALQTDKRNPALVEADTAIAAAEAREKVARYGYLPRVEVVAALWTRGSGYSTPNGPAPSSEGLVPNVSNWGVGLVVSWPALKIFAQQAEARTASADTGEAGARRREIELQVNSQLETAQAILDGARRVAANTPIALAAARAAEQQATARYRSGLTGVTEVAEAQRLLAQAEFDDAVARLGVRTATLLLARALGDMEPFLSEVSGPAPGPK